MTKKSMLFKEKEPKWSKAFSRTKWIFSSFAEQCSQYGFFLALFGLVWWIGIYSRCLFVSVWAIKHLTSRLDAYIEKKYDYIITKYSNIGQNGEIIPIKDYPIWVFWWQGIDGMPEIVRSCYNRIKTNNDNVYLITKDNVAQYVGLPEAIVEKVSRGEISYTHFSDILRLTLLAERGGMWIDATCFNPYTIPNEAKQMPFCSPHDIEKQIRLNGKYCYWCDSGGWRSWNIGTCIRYNKLFMFCRDLLQAFAINEKCFPNYFMVDCVIQYAYRKLPGVKEMIDEMPDINTKCADLFLFYFNTNKPYNESEYRKLIQDNWLFKLTYKTVWLKEINGQITFYGQLFNDK